MAKKAVAKAAKPGKDEVLPAVKQQGAEAVTPPAAGALKKKDFLDRVAASSGVRKTEARAVAEAVLAEIAAAIGRGDEISLPPLGKLRVTKRKPAGGGEVLTLKLRQAAAKHPAPDTAGPKPAPSKPRAKKAEPAGREEMDEGALADPAE